MLALFSLLKAAKDDTDLSYIWQHPKELVSPALITVLAMTVISLLAVVLRQKHTLAQFGVRLFSKHDSKDSKKKDWSMLRSDLTDASNEKSPLWLLGATGKETFSGAASPLYDEVRNYEGEIKVLLIRPESFAFKSRCRNLKVSADTYLEEILDSIDYCKDLAVKGKSITVKLYDQHPIWKMVMTTRVLWVQYYKHNTHVDNTPMYSFEYRKEGSSLFDGFRTVFTKRWSHDNSLPIDLEKFVRSDWAKHCRHQSEVVKA